jgi:predicted tellurium resistance membrane protein TerC
MLSDPQTWASLLTLTLLEVVLSVDNIVVIAVLVAKLPPEQRDRARYIGMTLAIIPRVIFLAFISWIIDLTEPLVTVFGQGFSGRDLILGLGGLFLIYKATAEMHESLEGGGNEVTAKAYSSFAAVITQIALIDIVFSIDSVITAVGMANEIWIMITAVVLAMIVLMVASGPVARFVDNHPTIKILALGFLLMIGMALMADSVGFHVPKGYIYSAMLFSIFIEGMNMLYRRRAGPLNPTGYLPRRPPPYVERPEEKEDRANSE